MSGLPSLISEHRALRVEGHAYPAGLSDEELTLERQRIALLAANGTEDVAMHEHWFTFHLPLTDDGMWMLPDLEAEIEFRVVAEDGEIEISAVNFEASRKNPDNPRRWARENQMVDLLKADDPIIRALGLKIKSAAEADDEWQIEALQTAGWHYVGLGGNDPHGRVVFTGEAAE